MLRFANYFFLMTFHQVRRLSSLRLVPPEFLSNILAVVVVATAEIAALLMLMYRLLLGGGVAVEVAVVLGRQLPRGCACFDPRAGPRCRGDDRKPFSPRSWRLPIRGCRCGF